MGCTDSKHQKPNPPPRAAPAPPPLPVVAPPAPVAPVPSPYQASAASVSYTPSAPPAPSPARSPPERVASSQPRSTVFKCRLELTPGSTEIGVGLEGTTVTVVFGGGAADVAGVRVGMRALKVNGCSVASFDDIVEQLAAAPSSCEMEFDASGAEPARERSSAPRRSDSEQNARNRRRLASLREAFPALPPGTIRLVVKAQPNEEAQIRVLLEMQQEHDSRTAVGPQREHPAVVQRGVASPAWAVTQHHRWVSGDRVLCLFSGSWYPAEIAEDWEDGQYLVTWADGSQSVAARDCVRAPQNVSRPVTPPDVVPPEAVGPEAVVPEVGPEADAAVHPDVVEDGRTADDIIGELPEITRDDDVEKRRRETVKVLQSQFDSGTDGHARSTSSRVGVQEVAKRWGSAALSGVDVSGGETWPVRRMDSGAAGASREDLIAQGKADLDQRTQRFGLEQVLVADDGNCQFRAIAFQLFGSQNYHTELRAIAVAQIREQEHAFVTHFGSRGEFEEYLRKMSVAGTWGDEITLVALRDALGVNIHVLNSDRMHGYIRYSPDNACARRPPLHVCLTYIAPIHYNALVHTAQCQT